LNFWSVYVTLLSSNFMLSLARIIKLCDTSADAERTPSCSWD
jgi:hypothetical protein